MPAADDAARRRLRAADTARWRSRRRRGVQLFQVEAGPTEYDLAIRYGGLKESQVFNKAAVNAALDCSAPFVRAVFANSPIFPRQQAFSMPPTIEKIPKERRSDRKQKLGLRW